MKKLKLTTWYPHYIKPVRIGWYDAPSYRVGSNSVIYRWYWNGRYWGNTDGYICDVQKRMWRGVAK